MGWDGMEWDGKGSWKKTVVYCEKVSATFSRKFEEVQCFFDNYDALPVAKIQVARSVC